MFCLLPLQASSQQAKGSLLEADFLQKEMLPAHEKALWECTASCGGIGSVANRVHAEHACELSPGYAALRNTPG